MPALDSHSAQVMCSVSASVPCLRVCRVSLSHETNDGYLAQGGTIKSLSWEFRVGRSTAAKIIEETCEVIWNVLSPIYLEKPNTQKWKEIAIGFWERWNFPNCLGAIDGKHIVIQCPDGAGSNFYSFKGSHSTILIAVCDSNYRFTLVDIGGYGSQGDRNIFANSKFGKEILNDEIDAPDDEFLPGSNMEFPFSFVGDEAFPLKKNILRPYPGKYLNQEKRIFNYRLSRARRTIENAFGILSARWRVFRSPIAAEPETVDKLVEAAVCLHNYLKTEEYENPGKSKMYCPDFYADQYDKDGNLIPGQWRRDVRDGNVIRDLGRVGANRADLIAKNLRDNFATYLLSDAGEVSWQYAYVNRGSVPQI